MTLQIPLLSVKSEKAQVEIIRGEEQLTLMVKTGKYQQFLRENPKKSGLIAEGQIGYIDPSSLEEGDLEEWMEKFADTKGLVVDLRYYPSYPICYYLGEYLLEEPAQFARMAMPNPVLPGNFYLDENFYTGGGSLVKAGLAEKEEEYPLYRGKVILLMDEYTQSHGEFTVMALRQAPGALVVGSPSIGADGNKTILPLPGGLEISFTGMGVYTPEGGQTQRVGLMPDVECRPTVEGLRMERDELLEKAEELILG